MKSLYGENETCLDFANEEVMKYLIKPLEKHENLKVILGYDGFNQQRIMEHLKKTLKKYENLKKALPYDDFNQQQIEPKKKITHITLDGQKSDFCITIYNHMIAIFILNEEFMFIDDEARKTHTSSDTCGNVVYKFIIILLESEKFSAIFSALKTKLLLSR